MNDTLEMLGIQWQKLIIQGISFSIVLIVLWKFAYKPIFKMLDERKAKIAEALANGEKIKGKLAQTEVDCRKLLTDAGDQANKLIEEAREAAGRERTKKTQEAVAAAEQIIAKAREAAAQERAQMLAQLKREVGRLVVQTTTTVTGKILTADDQTRLAQETEKQLAA
jgi:F-type H+-transporting ATPase subunit b